MKFECIFAMSTPKTRIQKNDIYRAFLCSEIAVVYRRYTGCYFPFRIPVDSFLGTVFGETEGDSLSCIHNSNSFPTMPKTGTICVGAKHSTTSTARSGAKSASVATIQLQCSNKYQIPAFADFLAECQRRFDEERDVKNDAYLFLSQHGLLSEFLDFREQRRGMSDI